ncbi:MAG: lytic transglycosylase domain-containing protein [Clostridia bacterium]|nr:lytic transglycosylase domain-containing protein [Clostridia bacterium]
MKKNIGIFSIIAITAIVLLVYLFLCLGAYLYPTKYLSTIEKYSTMYNVDKVVVASVINVESRFNKDAVSPKGAKGLMQLTDKTAIWLCEILGEEYGEEKMFEEEFNIKLGVYYLSYLINKFENLNTALASYNAGEGVVRGWLVSQTYSQDGVTISKIPYKETDNYVKKVNKNIKVYSKKFK